MSKAQIRGDMQGKQFVMEPGEKEGLQLLDDYPKIWSSCDDINNVSIIYSSTICSAKIGALLDLMVTVAIHLSRRLDTEVSLNCREAFWPAEDMEV